MVRYMNITETELRERLGSRVEDAMKPKITNRDALRFLTLERQFCVFCWKNRGAAGSESYRAAQVISVAERVGRSEKAYRQLRARRVAAHLEKFHPTFDGRGVRE
jgi:hypothetical protein